MAPTAHSAWKTRESLLERVRDPNDEGSWEDFVCYYRPFIYSLARGMRMEHFDAEEIVQNVLLKAWNKLPEFEYDRRRGRFRGWLCLVTGNAVRDFVRRRKTQVLGPNNEQLEDETERLCVSLPDIERIAEQEWKRHISELAWKAVSGRFKPHVAKAFLMAAEGVPTRRIVAELGLAESSVYVYKSRVQRELRKEIIRLNRLLG